MEVPFFFIKERGLSGLESTRCTSECWTFTSHWWAIGTERQVTWMFVTVEKPEVCWVDQKTCTQTLIIEFILLYLIIICDTWVTTYESTPLLWEKPLIASGATQVTEMSASSQKPKDSLDNFMYLINARLGKPSQGNIYAGSREHDTRIADARRSLESGKVFEEQDQKLSSLWTTQTSSIRVTLQTDDASSSSRNLRWCDESLKDDPQWPSTRSYLAFL